MRMLEESPIKMSAQRSAPGSADPKRREALHRILETRCSQSLYSEYETLSSEAQGMLLAALDGVITNALVETGTERRINALRPTVIKSKDKRNIRKNTCPIVSFIRTFVQSDLSNELCLDKTFLSKLKEKLSGWGINRQVSPLELYMCELSIEGAYQQLKEGANYSYAHTTSFVVKNGSSNITWSSLTPINISQLRIFETMKGCVLIGTTITTPNVVNGITIFLQDDDGNISTLGLYNYTSGSYSRVEAADYARSHIPIGTRIAIAEPFTKIFLSGQRGVRVDNPNEFKIIKGNVYESIDLPSVRAKGNKLVQRKNYQAAMDAYIEGLQCDISADSVSSFVSTILSNRAQTYIQLQNWGQALGDAAASLCIRPSCKKTWQRYNTAVEQLRKANENTIKSALIPARWVTGQCTVSKVSNRAAANDVKVVANSHYKTKQYQDALDKYTEAILLVGDDIRALLSNWSLCALHIGAIHDAVAASAASLRICSEEKAVYRLCNGLAQLQESDIALSILEEFNELPTQIAKGKTCKIRSLDELVENVRMAKGITLCESLLTDSIEFLSRKIPITPDWVSNKIELYMTSVKGRGIRVVNEIGTKIDKHELILIEKPLVRAYTDLEMDKLHLLDKNSDGTISESSQVLAKSILVQRCCHDQTLLRRLNVLHDGKQVGSEPICSVHDMLAKLSDVQPLLPSQSEYQTEPQVNVSHDRIHNILSINSFGSDSPEQDHFLYRKPSYQEVGRTTTLYTAISMFNHSKTPNCFLYTLHSGSTAIITGRSILAGEELTVCYSLDDTVLKKWGIHGS